MELPVIVFDVNETLTDMSPMAERFTDVGAPGHLAKTWFAGLLRDGFALSTVGENPAFADVGAACLEQVLHGQPLNADTEVAIKHIMGGIARLPLHSDVAKGVRSLASSGFELVTLTNGSSTNVETLLTDAKLRDHFSSLLSVENAPAWKPAASAYHYAAQQLATTPARMILVAVHPWDIHGASKAGLQTAWINRSGAPYPASFAAPDQTAGGIAELAGLLRSS